MTAITLRNLVRVTTATTGPGTITLGAAVAGFLDFADGDVPDGATVRYAIEDGSQREIGYGVYTAAGPTLTRNVLKSTNPDYPDEPIELSGSAVVIITAAAEDFVPPDASTSEKGVAKLWTMTIFTASNASWSVPAGTLEMIVEVWGAGGSGAAGNSSASSRGGAGAGGAYARKLYHGTMDSTLNVTVGAAATGVTASGSPANGNAGGTSSVVGSNLGTVQCTGGGGGLAGAGGGSIPGAATGGDINLPGQAGELGQRAGLTTWPAFGGNCPFGGFGGAGNVEVPGDEPGGGGACGNHTGGSVSGTGAKGRVIIWTR